MKSPFMMDKEFAKFSVGAVTIAPCVKVDIRQLKRNEVSTRAHIDKELENKPLLDKMMFKMKQSDRLRDETVSQDYFTSCMQSYKSQRKTKETFKNEEDSEKSYDEYKSFNLGVRDKDYIKSENSSAETSMENVLDDTSLDKVKEEDVKQNVKDEAEGEVLTC